MLFKAAWVAPISSAPIRDGRIGVSDGKIVYVGDAEPSSAHTVDLGASTVLPGLINAHTHLELSDRSCRSAPNQKFTDWILNLRSETSSPEQATREGVFACLKFYGVTCVGDITQFPAITRPILARSALRCVSFGEVLGLAKRRGRFDELLPAAIDGKEQSNKLRVGISPHAPYTVDLDGYRKCLELAKANSLPLATHLAENAAETEFLRSHSGMFRELYETLGSWQDEVTTYDGSPVEFARAIGLLEYPSLLAHVNYCSDHELDLLADGNASVVYCPRTHAYFHHPPHRWREMLSRGINVALGTDSCASSPNLDLLADLRMLRRLAPEIPAPELWQLITTRAAAALGLSDQIGTLEIGKSADLVEFGTQTDNPLEEILERHVVPSSVWIEGTRVSGGLSA